MIRGKFEAKSLTDGGQHQDDLHHRKRSSYTCTRPMAKRKVRIFWQALNKFRGPSFGFERCGLIIKSRIALRGPLKHEPLRARRNVIAANLAVSDRFAPESVRRRIEPQGFFYDLFCISQPREITDTRFTTAEHMVQFRMKLRFGF